MKELPTTVWSGSFRLFGVDVKCHSLSDGQRIIEAESMENLIAAMARSDALDLAQFDGLARWQAAAKATSQYLNKPPRSEAEAMGEKQQPNELERELMRVLENLLTALAMGPLEVAAEYGPNAHPDEAVVRAASPAHAAIVRYKQERAL